MKGVSTAFWSFVLISAAVSIGAGFVGGRSIGTAGALPPHGGNVADDITLPAPMHQRLMRRSLTGAHSLDAADAADPYADAERAVADHRRSGPFDARRERAKIAVVVIDAGRAGPALDAFVNAPLPLALVVSPRDEDARQTSATISGAGKMLLVDANAVKPAAVRALLAGGGGGIIGSLDRKHARALLRGLDRNLVVVDAALDEDDDLYRTAHAGFRHAFGRDITADARDDAPYVEFMLRNALAIAQRTGSAVVAIHARPRSFDALARFADRAQRDGADLVSLADLGS